MSDFFYNPYQFIPVDTKRAKELTAFEAKKDGGKSDSTGLERSDNKFVRHDFWHAESVSGRIRCSLLTLSPLVVGAEQVKGNENLKEPSRVTPYSLKRRGYAIPGNSLRGMIGSIAEVISQSTLRVLAPSGNIDVIDAFKKSAGVNSTPWSTGRTHLTPAEALFGVVEEDSNEQSTRNLASRLRFCDAFTKGDIVLQDEVTLKVLSSPKPPSPAMYFSATGGRYLTKEDLKKTQPNGRKYYIPHSEGKQFWKHNPGLDSKRNNLRLSCTPIEAGSRFYFDVYFENLSKQELGLLRKALQPAGPKAPFTHRLGLGKSYGLGHVSIDVAKVEVIDRQERYSLKRFINGSRYEPYDEVPDMSLIDQEEALPALLTIADRENYEDLPICYPYDQASNKSTHQSPDTEENGFQWFVENDRVGKHGRKDFLHRSPTSSAAANVMKPLASGKRRNQDS